MTSKEPMALQLRSLQTMLEISSEHNTTTFGTRPPRDKIDISGEAIMRQRWADVLDRDPYHNPIFLGSARMFR